MDDERRSIPTLGLAETWKINGNHVELLAQAIPYLSEGEKTLRPRTRQHNGFAAALTRLCKPDLQTVCFRSRRDPSPWGPP